MLERYNLRDYQKKAVELFSERKKLYINFDTGLGKTRTALAIAEKFGFKDVIVLAPLSAIPSWYSEAQMVHFPYKLRITTYERFRRYPNMFRPYENTLVIFDEAHRLKNPRTQTSKLAFQLYAYHPYKLMLSATPLDKLHEIYMQFKILEPSLFPMSYSKWINENFVLDAYFKPKCPIVSPEKLLEPVKPYLYTVRREDVLDLPPLTINKVELNKPKQLPEGLEITHNSLASFIQEFRVYQNTKEKFDWVLDYIQDNPRTLVFVYFLETIEEYKKRLGNKAYYITGQDKKDLEKILKYADKPVVATYSLKEGINLQAYHSIVFHTLPLAYRDYVQSVGRVYRSGQNKRVIIYNLLQADIDYVVYNILRRKKSVYDMFRKEVEK